MRRRRVSYDLILCGLRGGQEIHLKSRWEDVKDCPLEYEQVEQEEKYFRNVCGIVELVGIEENGSASTCRQSSNVQCHSRKTG